MGGRASKQKGDRAERKIVKLHKEMGVECQKVPLSGAVKAEGFDCDLRIKIPPEPLKAEVKARANGEEFRSVATWLEGNDLLFLIKDRAEPLVVMSWDTYEALVSWYSKSCGEKFNDDSDNEETDYNLYRSTIAQTRLD